MIRILGAAAVLTAALPCGLASQQTPVSIDAFHDQVVALLRTAARPQLPDGDTLVTWTDSPVLFHTSGRRANVRTAGLLRGDGMVGVAVVGWTSTRPDSFAVHWYERGKTERAVIGHVQGKALVVSGTRDTTIALPGLPWAVADYGMEDLLLPLTGLDGPTARIAVLRPYALKWDTLTIRVRSLGAVSVLELTEGDGKVEWLAVDGAAHFLWAKQAGQRGERRPLEGTQWSADWLRVRPLLADLK